MAVTFPASGGLIVSATIGEGAFPITGARVTVFDLNGSEIASSVTDSSGRTSVIRLPAPPAAASQIPGQAVPYAVYQVHIEADGYRPVDAVGTAIFAGTTAVLPVYLQPSSAGGTDREVFPPQDLNTGR